MVTRRVGELRDRMVWDIIPRKSDRPLPGRTAKATSNWRTQVRFVETTRPGKGSRMGSLVATFAVAFLAACGGGGGGGGPVLGDGGGGSTVTPPPPPPPAPPPPPPSPPAVQGQLRTAAPGDV